jgi:hypothetical protein
VNATLNLLQALVRLVPVQPLQPLQILQVQVLVLTSSITAMPLLGPHHLTESAIRSYRCIYMFHAST